MATSDWIDTDIGAETRQLLGIAIADDVQKPWALSYEPGNMLCSLFESAREQKSDCDVEGCAMGLTLRNCEVFQSNRGRLGPG